MSRVATPAADWLDPATLDRLERRFEAGLRQARRSGSRALPSVTTAGERDVDPTAVAAVSRREGEEWFCFEQPERDGSALAALGVAWSFEDTGPERFARVAERWRSLSAAALSDSGEGPTGSGLVALGGFAFAPDGGSAPSWEGFAAASLVV